LISLTVGQTEPPRQERLFTVRRRGVRWPDAGHAQRGGAASGRRRSSQSAAPCTADRRPAR